VRVEEVHGAARVSSDAHGALAVLAVSLMNEISVLVLYSLVN
jgi:hypothetical protein